MEYVLLGVLVVLIAWVIASYNKLIGERLKVQTQWKQIDVVLKQRSDLIPNLVETVKGYMAHEKETLQAVTDARTKYVSSADPSSAIQSSNELGGALGRLFAVAEAYPDLKANQGFLDLQSQITGIESKIADFRQFYNDMVMRYNRQVITFPSLIIAKLFHFEEAVFFNVEEGDKVNPKISFEK